MTKQIGFYFNSSVCTGCKACQISCKDKWDLPVGVTWRRVAEYTGGDWTENADKSYTHSVFTYYTSVACNHCENPACLASCPTQAIQKRDDGIVIIDQSLCIGCRYCEWACPYGAPQFDAEKGVMSKCNSCYDAVDAGGQPTCVTACPSRALEFGDLEELRAKHGDANAFAPLPDPSITGPSLVITPHENAAPVGSPLGKLANPEEI